MYVNIAKIEGNKLTVVKDEKVRTYEMQDNVIPFAKLGVADITFNDETKKVTLVKMQTAEEIKEGFKPTSYNKASRAKGKAQSGSSTDDMIKLEDLLNQAHDKFKGNFSVTTEMLQIDWEKKTALFKAKVEVPYWNKSVREGKEYLEIAIKVYEGYGDATQDNCGEMVKKHWIRMAETRAISRALRWATNNAKAAIEETEEAKKD